MLLFWTLYSFRYPEKIKCIIIFTNAFSKTLHLWEARVTSDDVNEKQVIKVAFEDFRTHFCVLDTMCPNHLRHHREQKCLSSPDNAKAVFPAFSEIRLKAFNTHPPGKSLHLPPTTAESEKQLQVSRETEVHCIITNCLITKEGNEEANVLWEHVLF